MGPLCLVASRPDSPLSSEVVDGSKADESRSLELACVGIISVAVVLASTVGAPNRGLVEMGGKEGAFFP